MIFVDIYVLGMLFVLLSKISSKTNKDKKKILLLKLFKLGSFIIFMSVLVFVGCFLIFLETSISFQQQTTITITYKHIMIYISVILEIIFMFIPIKLLFNMYKLEQNYNTRKNYYAIYVV
jgi:uncharacterized membrane protein YidH (DUF202 family)